ncbi:MAG: hypothetical protein QX199_12775 [Methylococcaceae bacterium]
MTTNIESDEQQFSINWRHKISGIDIEQQEMQFINDEVEYYKLLKTKSKKNSYAEDESA